MSSPPSTQLSSHSFKLVLPSSTSPVYVLVLSFGPGNALQLWILDKEGGDCNMSAAFHTKDGIKDTKSK